MKHITKCTTVAAVVLTMILQPCVAFTAQAGVDSYDLDGFQVKDIQSSNYDYLSGSEERKISSITKVYDDGAKDTEEYQYNEAGELIYSNVKDVDGNQFTIRRTYKGAIRSLESLYTYDATNEVEETITVEYREDGYPAYTRETYQKKGENQSSSEKWYLSAGNLLKYVTKNSDGTGSQADFTYNENGQPFTATITESNGNITAEEWHYNEAGEELTSKTYKYDAALNTKETTERLIDGVGNDRVLYIISIQTIGDSINYKMELWYRYESMQLMKEAYTEADGSQSIIDYAYDAEGEETLYLRANSDGTAEKRETTYTQDGSRTVSSDSAGNRVETSFTYDTRTELYTEEITTVKADGSSEYEKTVSMDRYGYDTIISITRQVSAGGVETYKERSYESDYSSTLKEKEADGTVTVTKMDTLDNVIGVQKTLPDGTTAERIQTNREDGQPITMILRYSDGGEDRIDYEYNDKGNLVKETETRRNGVIAVTAVQYYGVDDISRIHTVAFSNGCQFVQNIEQVDEKTERFVMTYSGGDVVEETFLRVEEGGVSIKTIYRDGRIEEFYSAMNTEEEIKRASEGIAMINGRMDSFFDQAWGMTYVYE